LGKQKKLSFFKLLLFPILEGKQLQDISHAEYLKQMVEPDAPVLAEVKGLISKVWLTDEEKNTFGGFYLWESKTAMENFMHSDL